MSNPFLFWRVSTLMGWCVASDRLLLILGSLEMIERKLQFEGIIQVVEEVEEGNL